MKKRFRFPKRALCLLFIAALCLTSCARVKEATGIDKVIDGGTGILPDRDNKTDGATSPSDGTTSGGETGDRTFFVDGTLISEGTEMLYYELPEDKLFKLGETFSREYVYKTYQRDDDGNLISVDCQTTMVIEFTVSDLLVLTNISDEIKKDILPSFNSALKFDQNEFSPRYDLNDFIDADGNLDDDYIFIMVDINQKYLSGIYEKTAQYSGGSLKVDKVAVSYKEYVYENEVLGKKTKMFYNEDYDKNGNLFVAAETFANYSVSETESWAYTEKGESYLALSIGEEALFHRGILLKKSDVEEWGVIVDFGDGYKVPLDINIDDYR